MTELNIRESAKEYRDHGLVVFPVKADGTKAPAVKWTQYKDPSFFTDEEFDRVFPEGSSSGLAVAWGDCSDGIFAIDIEYNDYVEKYLDALKHLVPELIEEIPMVLTPGKMTEGEERRPGMHLYFRCHDMTVKTQELTLLSKEEAKNRTGSDRKRTAIEIRGDGSYTLVPGGNPLSHPTGHPYELISNVQIWDAPVLSLDQYDTIINIAKSMSEDDEIQKSIESARPVKKQDSGEDTRPGTWYNETSMISMRDIISEYFTFVYSNSEGVEFYRRVGKDRGLSATYNYKGSGVLYVFTTSSHPFESGKSYTKLGAYAVANGLSYSEASKQIASHYREFLPSPAKGTDYTPIYVNDAPEMPDEPDDGDNQVDLHVPAQRFPLDVLPARLADYCESLSTAIGAPIDFAACECLALCSGAVGATRRIQMSQTHSEMCNLYMAIVGKPGRGKSPVFKMVTYPLMQEAAKLARKYEAKRTQYIEAENEGTSYRDEETGSTDKPKLEEIHAEDFTVEGLVQSLADNPRGITIPQDELTFWLSSMNKYAKGSASDVPFYLSAWNGSPYKKARKTGNERVLTSDVFLTIFGGIQPGRLDLITSLEHDANGFSHRFLFCYPEDKPVQYYQFQSNFSELTRSYWEEIYRTLRVEFEFESFTDEFGETVMRPEIVRPDDDAKLVFLDWNKQHVDAINGGDLPPGVENPYLKFTSHITRLALLLQSVWYAEGLIHPDQRTIVNGEIMEKARTLTEYFKSHLHRVIFSAERSPESAEAIRVYEYIKRKGGKATMRQMQHARIVKNADHAMKIFKTMESMFLGRFNLEKKEFVLNEHSS